MYRQHPSHPCPSFMGQRNHHPPPSSISSIIGFSAEVDLYQLKKPEIFSILVWNQGLAHRNSLDIGVDEDWICWAWKRITCAGIVNSIYGFRGLVIQFSPRPALRLSTAYWVVTLLRGKHNSPFMGFCALDAQIMRCFKEFSWEGTGVSITKYG